MATDQEALRRSIIANPDDDTLRLIYADAVEEGGNGPRAAFIREHIGSQNLPHGGIERLRFNRKYGALEAGFRAEDGAPPTEHYRRGYRRGLIGSASYQSLRDFVDHYPARRALHPITEIELKPGAAWRGNNIPREFEQIQILALVRHRRANHNLRPLLASPYIAALRGLDLSRYPLNRTSLFTLLEQPRPHMEGLDLSNQIMGLTWVAQFSQCNMFPNLRKLKLRNNGISAGMQMLASSPMLAQLEVLDISDFAHVNSINALNDAAIQSLVNSPYLRQLKTLCLNHNTFTPAGINILVNSPFADTLQDLELSHGTTRHGPDIIRAIARGTHISGLRRLDITTGSPEGRMSQEWLAAIRELAYSKRLTQLECIDVSDRAEIFIAAWKAAHEDDPERLPNLQAVNGIPIDEYKISDTLMQEERIRYKNRPKPKPGLPAFG